MARGEHDVMDKDDVCVEKHDYVGDEDDNEVTWLWLWLWLMILAITMIMKLHLHISFVSDILQIWVCRRGAISDNQDNQYSHIDVWFVFWQQGIWSKKVEIFIDLERYRAQGYLAAIFSSSGMSFLGGSFNMVFKW